MHSYMHHLGDCYQQSCLHSESAHILFGVWPWRAGRTGNIALTLAMIRTSSIVVILVFIARTSLMNCTHGIMAIV